MVNLQAAVGAVSESPVAPSSTPSVPGGAPHEAMKAEVVRATVTERPAQEPSPAQVKQAARQLESFMQSMNRYLEFRIDQDSGRTVVTVKDKTTGDVVRQIPAEEVLRLAQNLGGKGGALLNQAV